MMKRKKFKKIFALALCCVVLAGTFQVSAYTGSMGYEVGISAADPFEENTYTYREVCFITGTPIMMEGTMTVKKNVRADRILTTYSYNLSNVEQDASITRVVMMNTYTETKENGQKVESSEITDRTPTEVIRAGGITYTLSKYRFTRSGITDPNPAVDYNAGEYILTKTFKDDSGGTVTLEMTGNQYGYDQYWSSAKAGTVNINISAEPSADTDTIAWGGFANVSVSNTAKKDFKYVKNEPWQISFEGGYVEQNWEESILEYTATLPEFDKDGNATEVLKKYSKRIGIDTSPVSSRLMVPDLKHLEGHWAEESIKILFSLEVLPGTGEDFNPAKYINRSEYTAMVVRAVKEIPVDPDLITRTATKRPSKGKTVEISPFADLEPGDPFYTEIKEASTRGIVKGTGQAYFSPESHITMAEAVTMLIRALGLEGLAPYPNAVTPFADNDRIPTYARNAAAVAYRIGLVHGDDRGYFYPDENLTYERSSELIYNLIQYMGEDLVKDYRERILSY